MKTQHHALVRLACSALIADAGCFPGPLDISSDGNDVRNSADIEVSSTLDSDDGSDLSTADSHSRDLSIDDSADPFDVDVEVDTNSCGIATAVGSVGAIGIGLIWPSEIMIDDGPRIIVTGLVGKGVELASSKGPKSTDDGSDNRSTIFVGSLGAKGLPFEWTAIASGVKGLGEYPNPQLIPIAGSDLGFGLGFVAGASVEIRGPHGTVQYDSIRNWSYAIHAFGQSGEIVEPHIQYETDGNASLNLAANDSGLFGLGSLNGSSLVEKVSGVEVLSNPHWSAGDPTSGIGFVAAYYNNGLTGLGRSNGHHEVVSLQGISMIPRDNDRLLLLGVATGSISIPGVGGPEVIDPSTDARVFDYYTRGSVVRSYVAVSDALDLYSVVGYRFRVFPFLINRSGGGAYLVARLRDGLRIGTGSEQVTLNDPHGGVFVAAFNAVGSLSWVRRIAWLSGDAQPHATEISRMDPIVVDRGAAGIVIGGDVTGTISVENPDGAPIEITNPGGDGDGFLVGYTWDGKLEFAFNAVQGAGRGGVKAIAVTEDAIVVGGDFEGPTTFGPRGKAGAINDISGYGGYLMRLEAKALECGKGFDGNPGP